MIVQNFDIDLFWWWFLVAITTEELVWVLKAKVGDFIDGMKRTKKTQDETGESTEKSTRKWKAFAGLLAGIVVAAVAAVATAIARVSFEMASNAAKQQQLTRAFHNLARSAGESGNAILRAMREGLGGAASQMDIVLEANRALVSGLPASAEKMGELTRVARGMARIMGIDVTEALQRMVRGISKQEIELLDELFGGSVRFQDILKKLPASASAAERQMAIYNEVLRIGAQRVKEAGLESTGFDTTIGKMRANIAELKVAVGDSLIPVFESLATKIGNAAEKLKDFLSDETVARLRQLGQDDLADQQLAALSVQDLESRRSGAGRDAEAARLALARLRGTDAPGGFRNRAAARRATAEAAGALTLEGERAALDKLTKAEIEAIKSRIAAQEKLAEVSDGNARRTTAAEFAARKALKAAREQEESLRKERDAVLAVVEALEKQAQLEAEIVSRRKEAEGITAPLGLKPKGSAALTAQDILRKTKDLADPTGQRAQAVVRGFNVLNPDAVLDDDVLRQKVEITPVLVNDAKLERDMKSAAERAAKKGQDAMTRFTREVPSEFERNMQRAFNSVQSLASGFGLRTQGILSGAFNIASGGAALAGIGQGAMALKLAGTLGKVASVLGPIGAVIGGAVGVFQGVRSLLKRQPTQQAPAQSNPYLASDETVQNRLRAIDVQIARQQRDFGHLYEDEETGDLITEAQFRARYPGDPLPDNAAASAIAELNRQRAPLADIVGRRAQNRQQTGDVTYSAQVTLTENTGKNMLAGINTAAAHLSNIESAIVDPGNGVRALLEDIRDMIKTPPVDVSGDGRGSGLNGSYTTLRSRLRANGLDG